MTTSVKSLYAFLVFGIVASIVLWMPFGVGYYGWPWQFLIWRFVLYFFVLAFPLLAAVGCFSAFRGGFSVQRFALPFAAFLVGIFGVLALFSWLGRYVEPMLHGIHPHP